MPAMMFSSVDFPQPDGPTMLTNLPSSTLRLMSSRTMNWVSLPGLENFFVRLRTVIAVDSIGSDLTVGCDLTRAISMLQALCAMVLGAGNQVANWGRQANTRRAHKRNARRSINVITIMKLTPHASIMSTRVSWNQLMSSCPMPLPAPKASATNAIFQDNESAIRSEENMYGMS